MLRGKTARLQCKVPSAPGDEQHLLQPQDKPLVPGRAVAPPKGCSASLAAVPAPLSVPGPSWVRCPMGTPPALQCRQGAGLPLALCTSRAGGKVSPEPPKAGRDALCGGSPVSWCSMGRAGPAQHRLRERWGTRTPRGQGWEAAPQPGRGSGREQGLGLAQLQRAHLLGWLQLPSVAF